jgi:hypothetical protein
MCEGNRNSHGLELRSAGAERGNYPEAKPNERDRKADLHAMTRDLEVDVKAASASPCSTASNGISIERTGKLATPQKHVSDVAQAVQQNRDSASFGKAAALFGHKSLIR